jgi:hypothetical protein
MVTGGVLGFERINGEVLHICDVGRVASKSLKEVVWYILRAQLQHI